MESRVSMPSMTLQIVSVPLSGYYSGSSHSLAKDRVFPVQAWLLGICYEKLIVFNKCYLREGPRNVDALVTCSYLDQHWP